MEARTLTPPIKRCFDLIVTGMLVICLSPLFLLVALLIRLESRGPIFYYSYRVGQGYKVFRFYKFRSMKVNADKMVDQLKHKNQYGGASKGPQGYQLTRADLTKTGNLNMMVSDDMAYPVEVYEQYQSQSDENSFVKFKNDPRITRVGKFIRNTSIDELPQLFNILKGDMSLVGNRPLPLYEAEKLTKDDTVGRFLAPAGLTGLWQVTERGKDNMTPESRCKLDIEYALHHNFWMDIKILLKTPLAAFQHENV